MTLPRRFRLLLATALLPVALVLLATPPAARADGPLPAGEPQYGLPVARLTLGMHIVQAQIAETEATREKGLMYRTELPGNDGMLFVFPEAAGHCFWMRNTPLPLSIAFIDDDGVIANVADMKPFDETSHCPARPVRYALEMAQGWFARRGIQAGMKVGMERR